jgi:hypothetical protein
MSERALTAHSKINMQDAEERTFWCGFFDVSEGELAAAVDRVGAYVALLDEHFQSGRSRAA